MNSVNYNRAIEKLVFYRRMAAVAEMGTPTYTTYVGKLDGGITTLANVYDKDFDEVYRDVCEAYDSKYRR